VKIMGRIKGSKNGTRKTRFSFSGANDLREAVEEFKLETKMSTLSEAIVKLIRYGILYYYYHKK